MYGIDHRITIPAYAIEQEWWQLGVPKNEMSLLSLILNNDTHSLVKHYVALFQKFIDTPINGRPSLFRIDSVHQMEFSLSHSLLVY
jgi:hypothetical protein